MSRGVTILVGTAIGLIILAVLLQLLSPAPLTDAASPGLAAIAVTEGGVWKDVAERPVGWQRLEAFAAGDRVLAPEDLSTAYDGDPPTHFFIGRDGQVFALARWFQQRPSAAGFGGASSASVLLAGDALDLTPAQRDAARSLSIALGLPQVSP